MTTAILFTAFNLFCIWCIIKVSEFFKMKKIIQEKNKQFELLKLQNLYMKQRLIINKLINK